MRYKITEKFKQGVISYLQLNNLSMDKFSDIVGFEIKNILYRNKGINEFHLTKIKELYDFHTPLEMFKFPYETNFGKYNHKIYPKKIHKPQKSSKLAEFIGIMLGDGHLRKTGIVISLNKNEKEYIKFIKKIIHQLFDIDASEYLFKNKELVHIVVYSKKLTEYLQNCGLIPGSKVQNQIGIPPWIFNNQNFIKSCIRGLIDTDGCVYRCKRDKATYINFSNKSIPLLEDLQKMSKIIRIPFTHSSKKSLCIYKKEDVHNYVNIVGFSNKKHIIRGYGLA